MNAPQAPQYTPRIQLKEGEVTFTFANGEQIRMCFTDSLGIEGYGVRVNASKLLAVLPSSGNAVILSTPKAMADLEAKVCEVVAARDAKTAAASNRSMK